MVLCNAVEEDRRDGGNKVVACLREQICHCTAGHGFVSLRAGQPAGMWQVRAQGHVQARRPKRVGLYTLAAHACSADICASRAFP